MVCLLTVNNKLIELKLELVNIRTGGSLDKNEETKGRNIDHFDKLSPGKKLDFNRSIEVNIQEHEDVQKPLIAKVNSFPMITIGKGRKSKRIIVINNIA